MEFENNLPDYVKDDDALMGNYIVNGFYPNLDILRGYVGYIFVNPDHMSSVVSDFYIEPLFHIKSGFSKSIHVFQLRSERRFLLDRICWAPSSVFKSLSAFSEWLVNTGAYNLDCTAAQWKRIWKSISDQFAEIDSMAYLSEPLSAKEKNDGFKGKLSILLK